MLVDEGTRVKAGDLIAVLDPSELQTQEAAADATITELANTKWRRCSTPSNLLPVRLRAT